jgi:hypothetical protein
MTDNPACRRASRRKIGADRVVPVDRGGAADHEVMHCHLLCCLGNDLSTAGTYAVRLVEVIRASEIELGLQSFHDFVCPLGSMPTAADT